MTSYCSQKSSGYAINKKEKGKVLFINVIDLIPWTELNFTANAQGRIFTEQ